MEEKDKDFKELRIKNELESRKKKPNKFEDGCDNETLGKSIYWSIKEESMVANEFNNLWDKFLRSQEEELNEDLRTKKKEFENKLKDIIENINEENMMKKQKIC